MFKKALILFLPLFFSSCMTETPSESRSISGNKYTNSDISLSMQFPANWNLKLDQKFGAIDINLVALGVAVSNFSPNVTVILNPHTGSNDWNKIQETVAVQIKAGIKDAGQYISAIKTRNNKNYLEISYTTTNSGTLLKIKQELLLHNNIDVTVTYTDLASRFDQNQEFVAIDSSMSI